ncbi:MAG: hypothetical protein AAF488_07050 [Planctomycetota bacterium]
MTPAGRSVPWRVGLALLACVTLVAEEPEASTEPTSETNGRAAPTGVSPVLAGWTPRDGFHIRDAEDNYRLRLFGRFQTRFTNETLSPRGNGGNGRDTNAFDVNSFRVGLEGHLLSSMLGYRVELDTRPENGGTDLTDAYVHLRGLTSPESGNVSIGIGQFKPGFLRQHVTSLVDLQFVDRHLVNDFFQFDRGVGVWGDATFGPATFRAAIANGFGDANRSPDQTDHVPAFLFRVDWHVLDGGGHLVGFAESDPVYTPAPALVFGAAFLSDGVNGSATNDPGDAQYQVSSLQLDGAFKYLGFSLQGEYVARWLNYDEGAPSIRGDTVFANGFYLQAGVFVVPSVLEIAFRGGALWSRSRPDSGAGVEVGPAVNWYISRSHRIKLQADVSFVDVSGSLQVPSDALRQAIPYQSRRGGADAGDQGVISRVQLTLAW